jgi:hypothetical protein
MPTKSTSKIIAREPNWLGPAIPPGELLLEEYLKPLGVGSSKRPAAELGTVPDDLTRESCHSADIGLGEVIALEEEWLT